jgi:hypothetical protein
LARDQDPGERFAELSRAFRGSLASLRAAAETLELFPAMAEDQRRRLRAVVAGEATRLGELIDHLEDLGETAFAPAAEGSRRRVSAAELATHLAAHAFARLGLEIEREEGEPATLEVDVGQLVEAGVGLLAALRRDFGVASLRLNQRVLENHAVLDLIWPADAEARERLPLWQSEALERPDGLAPGLRPAVRRHGGEAWLNVDRERDRAYVRFLLPLAAG